MVRTAQSSSIGADEAITFVVTSCGRFDLLEECLYSFLVHNSAYISRYLIIEDSGDCMVTELVRKFDVPFEAIINDQPRGQIANIDHAYSNITTPYIFHCEDDWRFTRSGFIEESIALLEHDPSITNVLIRRPGQNFTHDRIYESPIRTLDGLRYHKPAPWFIPQMLGYSFNPGLRRLADYKLIGSFGRWGDEVDASIFFKIRGMTVAALAEPACETTGSERRLRKQKCKRSLRSKLQRFEAGLRYERQKLSKT